MDLENHIPSEDLQDWKNLKQEVFEIIEKEERNLELFDYRLQKAEEFFSEFSKEKSRIYLLKVKSAREDIEKIKDDLGDIKEKLDREPENLEELTSRFNYIGVLVGPVIKRCTSLRTRLMRHTPPLGGKPLSPHPRQQHPENDELESVTVDYLRSSCLFSVETNDEGDEELKWSQKPILRENAEEVSKILFDYEPDISLAFNGAIGAIKTARSLIEKNCLEDERFIALHEKSWLEIKFDVKDSSPDIYQFTESTSGEELMDILERDDIGGLIVEPVMNHPKMSAMDIKDLLERLAERDKFDEPKYLLIDSAHVPGLNPFEHIRDELPSNLCLLNAVSTVKFLQAGWDLTKGGVLGVKVDEEKFDGEPIETLYQIRGNNGTGLSYEEAELMSMETRESYESRMKRYDRNISIVRKELQKFVNRYDLGEIGFVENAKLLYINLNEGLDEKTRDIQQNILDKAEKNNIPLMDASSFGMNAPHIHFVLHPEEGQVIRLSPGSTNKNVVKKLTKIIKQDIEEKARDIEKYDI